MYNPKTKGTYYTTAYSACVDYLVWCITDICLRLLRYSKKRIDWGGYTFVVSLSIILDVNAIQVEFIQNLPHILFLHGSSCKRVSDGTETWHPLLSSLHSSSLDLPTKKRQPGKRTKKNHTIEFTSHSPLQPPLSLSITIEATNTLIWTQLNFNDAPQTQTAKHKVQQMKTRHVSRPFRFLKL